MRQNYKQHASDTAESKTTQTSPLLPNYVARKDHDTSIIVLTLVTVLVLP